MENVALTMLLYAFHFHKVFRSAKGFVAVPTQSQNNGIALVNPKCKSFILTAKHRQIITTIVASYFKVKNPTIIEQNPQQSDDPLWAKITGDSGKEELVFSTLRETQPTSAH